MRRVCHGHKSSWVFRIRRTWVFKIRRARRLSCRRRLVFVCCTEVHCSCRKCRLGVLTAAVGER
ncbi:hypothetical protein KP509_21G066300 [Ceratopteris richardii]|uniref:Uncharacterized protein n=1 Tax=Ceratopteris richardii TaxID=49495 RepID=A0A8T2SCA5_CERRI|nr:hypothetical protein KP509_21G066300 [Ceratopteris richardii]